MSHPLRDLIASRVAQRDEDLIPLPKYMLAVSISANTLDELHNAISQLDIDFATEWREREQVDSTDGRTSVLLDVTSRDQTPERYAEQLSAWSSDRRATQSAAQECRHGYTPDQGCPWCEKHKPVEPQEGSTT